MTDTSQTVTYETFVADQRQGESFLSAIEQLAPRLGQQHRFWVAGEERGGDGWEDEYSPADHRVLIGSFAAGTVTDVDDAIYAARAAQPDWAATSWRERVEIISRISGLVATRRYELAAILAYEIGKPVLEALGEVDELIALADCYCEAMVKHDGFEMIMSQRGDEQSVSVMRPHGVWVVIGPFNFPMALGLGPIAAAVIAGNTCVFKPSPLGYWSGLMVHELFRDAGIPPGVLNTVTVPDDRLGDALFARDDVDGLTFTGSYETGMRIYAGFQRAYPRPCICEMGGKNAAIVTATADLAQGAQGVARSAFGFSGQRCSGCERVFVEAGVYDEFAELLEEQRRNVRVGSPLDPTVETGPVVTAASVDRLLAAVAECHQAGWPVHGGTRFAGDLKHGYFLEPTVVEVPVGSRLLRDELFTPFTAVAAVESLDHALDQANSLVFALTAGLYSESPDETRRFLQRIQAGVVYVNRAAGATTGAWPGVQPFGGWRGSGSTGRGAGGAYYLEQYMREQSRTIVGPVLTKAGPAA